MLKRAALGLVAITQLVACLGSMPDEDPSSADEGDELRWRYRMRSPDLGTGTTPDLAGPVVPPADMGSRPCSSGSCYYISDSGSGLKNGSDWGNACAGFSGSCAVASLKRGATYFVADGSYPGYNFNTAAGTGSMITIKKAVASDHGTEAGWSAAMGDGQAAFNSEISFNSADWTLDGQTGGGPQSWTSGFGFKINVLNGQDSGIALGNANSMGSANRITIKHVEILGQGRVPTSGEGRNTGFQSWGSTDVTGSYLYIHETGTGPWLIAGVNLLFEYVYVGKFYGDAANHSEIASIWGFARPFGNMTFRYNVFTHLHSTGGLMWDNSSNPSSHLSVYGNVFYKPAGAVWQVANGAIGGWTANGSEMRNLWVLNNTFINIDQQSLSTLPQIASGCKAQNNLFYNSNSPDFSKFPTHDYNEFINAGGTHSELNGTSGTSNPFVNFTALDFTLTANTAPGTNLGAPYNVDALGNPRTTWTRGAYEFNR